MTIRAAILGPTGYTGFYLIELLLRHPQTRITYLASQRQEVTDVGHVFPQFFGRLPAGVSVCRPIDPDVIAKEADVVFLCLPHRFAMVHVPRLLDAGLRVIDLSADYRLLTPEFYEKVYAHKHLDPGNLAEAVYGLPELFRKQLRGAMLVANPGCYPTVAALAIAPLLSRKLVKPGNIIINAASGVTGAGRAPKQNLHFPEANEAFGPYGEIGHHRHQREIEQTLSTLMGQPIGALFVPHLIPADRGILATIYLEPANDQVSAEDLFGAFRQTYEGEPFIRLRLASGSGGGAKGGSFSGSEPPLPNIKYVRDTNYCDMAVHLVDGPPRRVVVFAAIDNMIKGASGQAIQNMNLLFEQDEKLGLI